MALFLAHGKLSISTEADVFNGLKVKFNDIIGVVMQILVYMYIIIHTYTHMLTQVDAHLTTYN